MASRKTGVIIWHVMSGYRWNEWNLRHIEPHGVVPDEAEYVIDHASPPWPRKARNNTMEVFGQTQQGRFLHVVYVLQMGHDVYVIHARPMTEVEKRRYRKGNR